VWEMARERNEWNERNERIGRIGRSEQVRKKRGSKYRLVIFDMDDTLLNSRGRSAVAYEWAYRAFEKTLSRYGLSLSRREIDTLFLAPLHAENEEGVRKFCRRFNLNVEDFWRNRERDVIEAKKEAMRSGEITLCEGAYDVVKDLSEDFLLAVVSDSQQECVEFALEHFKLKPFFAVWHGRSSDLHALSLRKPNPFHLNLVLDELKVPRENAILVDDSPLGILAAKRAGMDAVLVSRTKVECEPKFWVKDIRQLRDILL